MKIGSLVQEQHGKYGIVISIDEEQETCMVLWSHGRKTAMSLQDLTIVSRHYKKNLLNK
jgi:hypothetical protein